MAQIAGLQDFRQQGPPADTGVFQMATSILVFEHTFSGTTYVVAVRSGERGWVLVDMDVDARTVIQAAMDTLTGGGVVYIRNFDYTLANNALTPNYSGITLQGENMQTTILRLPAGSTHHVIERNLAAPDIYFFTVRDLHIYGNGEATGGDGIHITLAGTHDVNVDDVRITACYDGYFVDSDAQKVYNLVAEHNVHDGIYIDGGRAELVVCYAYDNGHYGYYLNSYQTAIGCYSYLNGSYGWFILGSYNQVIGGRCYFNFQTAAGTKSELWIVNDHNIITDMVIDGNATSAYCIRLGAGAEDNIIMVNQLLNHVTNGIWVQGNNNWIKNNIGGTVNDEGTGNKYAVIDAQFVQLGGGAAWVDGGGTPAGTPSGIDVDADGADYALAHKPLPLEVQQVVRITIWAYSRVVEADHMRLQILVNGGASSEQWDAEPIDVVNKPSVTDAIAIDDVVYWVITASDDADLNDLIGGDFLEIVAMGEAAGDGDCATDALFGGIAIEVV